MNRSTRSLTLWLLCSTLGATSLLSGKSLGWNADALSVELDKIKALPPVTSDITELKFADFYIMPIGAEGMTYTEKLKQLSGSRIRILGFMVKQTRPIPGVAILCPYAATTQEGEYGLCDDLPPTALFVEVAKYADLAVPYTPGPLLLTGTLETGSREEADGRVSYVRLRLDPEAAPQGSAADGETTAVNSAK